MAKLIPWCISAIQSVQPTIKAIKDHWIYIAIIFLLTTLLDGPRAFYAEQVRRVKALYDLPNDAWGKWLIILVVVVLMLLQWLKYRKKLKGVLIEKKASDGLSTDSINRLTQSIREANSLSTRLAIASHFETEMQTFGDFFEKAEEALNNYIGIVTAAKNAAAESREGQMLRHDASGFWSRAVHATRPIRSALGHPPDWDSNPTGLDFAQLQDSRIERFREEIRQRQREFADRRGVFMDELAKTREIARTLYGQR